MACYKNIQPEMRSRKLDQHIIKCNSESSLHYGIIVPVPWGTKPEEEYENPTELNRNIKWEMRIIYPCVQGGRKGQQRSCCSVCCVAEDRRKDCKKGEKTE